MHAYSYAEAIKESNNTELVAITDEDEERGKSLAQKYDASYYASYTDMLKTNMDAVIVTSENSYHCKHVVAAAQAGKHILCEKPMATTICDAKKMIEACEVNK